MKRCTVSQNVKWDIQLTLSLPMPTAVWKRRQKEGRSCRIVGNDVGCCILEVTLLKPSKTHRSAGYVHRSQPAEMR